MPTGARRLITFGASVRALADSARRAGWEPLAADCFADQDLVSCQPPLRISKYPDDFVRVAENWPTSSWVYTGGLENYPDIVDRIADRHSLLGNPGSVLRLARNVTRLSRVLTDAGFRFPRVVHDRGEVPREERWLEKRFQSAGGMGVRSLASHSAHHPAKQVYYQELIDGLPCSAVYVANSTSTELVGVCQQIVNQPWTAAPAYAYAGSVGPLTLSDATRSEVLGIGEVVRRACGLRGLFGIDAILAGDQWWVLEVNPRYTASAEVLERNLGIAAVAMHISACKEDGLLKAIASVDTRVHGKAICYASQATTATPEFCAWVADNLKQKRVWPALADTPHCGTRFKAGQPVLTVFADGSSRESVLQELRQRVYQVRQQLAEGTERTKGT